MKQPEQTVKPFAPCPANLAQASHNYQVITGDTIYCTQCGDITVFITDRNVV